MSLINARLDKGEDGSGLTFELVLLDGNEDKEFPTSIQIEDSSDQISLAKEFGLDEDNIPYGKDVEEAAYDMLEKSIGETIPADEYFAGVKKYKKCNQCGVYHRVGYGGDCNDPVELFLNV